MFEYQIEVRLPETLNDREWVRNLWQTEWGGQTMVSKGVTFHVNDVDALIAWNGNDRVGALTYHLAQAECELLSINSVIEKQGVGTTLLRTLEGLVRKEGCRRIWLITSNDNLDALRFYQRLDYRFAAVYQGAIDRARLIKPTIPAIGLYEIPIHDEIELEKMLAE